MRASWRLALRIARRDALRAKGRSLLVLAMIALPVLGVTGIDVIWRSSTLTTAQRADRALGRADALLELDTPGAQIAQAPFAADGVDMVAMPPSGGSGSPGSPEQQRSMTTDPVTLATSLLPAGSVLVPVPNDRVTMASTRDGLLQTRISGADLADPVWHGRLDLVSGRAPAGDQEVAATQAFLDQSGLKVGDTTELHELPGRPLTITGVAENPDELGNAGLVAEPKLLAAVVSAREQQAVTHSWLVKLAPGQSLDWAGVRELNRYGFAATSRSVVLHPPARSAVPYYARQGGPGGVGRYLDQTTAVILGTVAGMALLEIVLLAGPAFAVGARRSRRQLGLLAAAGGDRGQVRAVVLGGGVVLGLTGAAIGSALAVLLVAVGQDRLELMGGRRFGSFTLAPLDLLGVIAVGLVTGLLAAVVPAVQASRQDVVAALTGRGTTRRPSRRLLLLGLLMLGGGSALALLGAVGGAGGRTTAVLGGSMVAELGMVACVPSVIGLFGRLGRFLPLAPRLALRDSVRQRARTAPAVAAVMAAVAGSVAVGIYTASSNAEQSASYTPSAPDRAVTLVLTGFRGSADGNALQRAAVEQSIPALGARADVGSARYGCDQATSCGDVAAEPAPAQRCPADDAMAQGQPVDVVDRLQRDPRCRVSDGTGRFGSIVTGGPEVLHNLFAVHDRAVEQAAAAGSAVVFNPSMLQDGKALIRITDPWKNGQQGRPPYRDVLVNAVLAPDADAPARVYLPPQTLTGLGLTSTDAGSVWLPDAMPSAAAEQKATAAVAKVSGNAWGLSVERGFQPQHTVLALGLTAFAGLVALGAAGFATGLAAADSQRDLATLAAVGAGPGIRRRLSGFQCGVIAAMGTVLGVVCGIVPAVALRKVEGQAVGSLVPSHVVIAVPWGTLALTLVALPLLATVLAALLTRSRIALVRRPA
ncbi:FtsX-like permease family protein [Kitasatospora viridis]|uniref:Putative ABC transport system permease protein n=1 Tax=Kitasatospora viridis TaxID=281105 RepID=A0A561UFB2_9ACTN|nr:FtsX-like permease family protein [Kitasatospora viridis]TWF98046.1 putative ABC transport system permease protein [Kitasatospora viridis]